MYYVTNSTLNETVYYNKLEGNERGECQELKEIGLSCLKFYQQTSRCTRSASSEAVNFEMHSKTRVQILRGKNSSQ